MSRFTYSMFPALPYIPSTDLIFNKPDFQNNVMSAHKTNLRKAYVSNSHSRKPLNVLGRTEALEATCIFTKASVTASQASQVMLNQFLS